VNDPREAKRWNLGLRYLSSDESIKAYCNEQGVSEEDIGKTVSGIAQSSAHLICFAIDNLPRRDDSSNVGSETGRGFAHSAMWYHYAAKHTGVCLVFDKRILERAIRAWGKKAQGTQGSRGLWIYHGEVSYRDVSFNSIAAQTDDPYCVRIEDNMSLQHNASRHVMEFYRPLFFQKNLDWAYEREYRWIFWSVGDEPLFVNYGSALVGIVVGEDFGNNEELGDLAKQVYVRELDRLCAIRNIRHFQIWWDNGAARLAPRTVFDVSAVKRHSVPRSDP
jgi:hypothetical protein